MITEEQIQKLSLKDGDILVIKSAEYFSIAELDTIVERILEISKARVFVMSLAKDQSIETLSKEDAIEALEKIIRL